MIIIEVYTKIFSPVAELVFMPKYSSGDESHPETITGIL